MVFGLLRRRSARPRSLELAQIDGGFELRGEPSVRIRWEDIYRVTAFKRDLLTTDLLCLAFELVAAAVPHEIEVNEEVSGFDELIARLAVALPIVKDWRSKVLLPPFETNATVIYERQPDGIQYP